jgi:putative MATE family efflux protein
MQPLIRAFSRIFSCSHMLKPKDILGDIPTTKEGYRTTFLISWPSIVEAVLVSLMASVDTMMVGTINPQAIAAVGITNQPRFIVMAMIFSLNTGITAVVARRKGEDNYLGANGCLKQCIIISGVLSLLMAALGSFFADPLMLFAGAEEDILGSAVSYFRITMIGMVFTSLSLTINAAQRGIGNTRISMVTNLAANVVNVIFNYLLINGIAFFPELGVNGAAIGTVMGNITAFFMSLRSVYRPKKFDYLDITCEASWKFDKRTVSSILNVSGSAMVEQVFMRIGFFAYAKIVAELGTIAFATHQICMQILNLSFAVGDGFSIAASSLVGQSLGAKRPDLAKLYASISQRIALIASTFIFLLFFFGRNFLVGLFTDDPAIIAQGAVLMIIMAFTTHVQTSQVIISGCLRGAGDTKFVALTSFLSIAIVRPTLSWVLCFPLQFGLVGAWIGVLIDQSLRFLCNFLRFLGGKWTKIQL